MLGSNKVLDACLQDIESLFEKESIAEYIGYKSVLEEKPNAVITPSQILLFKSRYLEKRDLLDEEIRLNSLTLLGNSFTYYFLQLEKASLKVNNYRPELERRIRQTVVQNNLTTNYNIARDYVEFVICILDRFTAVVRLHHNLFKEGKIKPNAPNYTEPLPINNESQTKEKLKLKTVLTVEQLTYLFRLLRNIEPEIFSLESDAELYRFISQSFTTKRKTSDLSVEKIRILFGDSELEKKNVVFWETKLTEMLEQARKDRKKFI